MGVTFLEVFYSGGCRLEAGATERPVSASEAVRAEM